MNSTLLYGRNAVLEYLKSGEPVQKVLLERSGPDRHKKSGLHEGSDKTSSGNTSSASTSHENPERHADIIALLTASDIPYHFVEKTTLNRLCDGRHQGVAAYIEKFSYAQLDDILAVAEARGEAPFIIALDGVEDPHNLGALIRTAEAAGVHGIIIPARRSAGVTPAAVKVSAGAAAHIAVAQVPNLVQTLKILQKKGCWVWGADMNGIDVRNIDLSGAIVWVLGSEGKGLSRLTRETCDEIVSLPMHGQTSSLNVSVAGGILMYQTYLRKIPD